MLCFCIVGNVVLYNVLSRICAVSEFLANVVVYNVVSEMQCSVSEFLTNVAFYDVPEI